MQGKLRLLDLSRRSPQQLPGADNAFPKRRGAEAALPSRSLLRAESCAGLMYTTPSSVSTEAFALRHSPHEGPVEIRCKEPAEQSVVQRLVVKSEVCKQLCGVRGAATLSELLRCGTRR